MRSSVLPKKMDTPILQKQTKTANKKAITAHRMASTMLPFDLAGWKYTVIVATMCFPSCCPSDAAIAGTNVARLPNK